MLIFDYTRSFSRSSASSQFHPNRKVKSSIRQSPFQSIGLLAAGKFLLTAPRLPRARLASLASPERKLRQNSHPKSRHTLA
jgi:hypothetical protein